MTAPRHHDLTKTTLGVLTIGVLIATSLWILRPFLGATIWAAMVMASSSQLTMTEYGRKKSRPSVPSMS